jgi:hypothetical protein
MSADDPERRLYKLHHDDVCVCDVCVCVCVCARARARAQMSAEDLDRRLHKLRQDATDTSSGTSDWYAVCICFVSNPFLCFALHTSVESCLFLLQNTGLAG